MFCLCTLNGWSLVFSLKGMNNVKQDGCRGRMCPSNCAPATGGRFATSAVQNTKKKNPAEAGLSKNGRGTGIRTPEWRDQNPLPYRLATPLQKLQNSYLLWCGRRDSNSYASRRWNLNPVRLPISPLPHTLDYLDNKVVATAGIEPATPAL